MWEKRNSNTLLCVCMLSHVLLFATLWTVACQTPLSMGFYRQEYWSGLPFPPPVDHVLSELFTMTFLAWVALHGIAHSFTELHKPFHHDKVVIHAAALRPSEFIHLLAESLYP